MSGKSTSFELSRRKVLAGLGGVGLASAGAGLGTSAYLNDTESFEGNTIAAGQLDLKVDWEEHYSYPQLYGFDDPENGLEHGVHRSEPDEPDNYVGMPDPSNPQVWVHEDDLGTYMTNTSIEAFPDPNNDGAQEVEYEDWTYMPCDHGADLPEHLTPSDGNATRTDLEYMEDGEPLINLQDVKPGDFGEFTLSFHLCDNPGYVWLRAMGFTESGGETAEPEPTPDNGELAENIQTVWWYDGGDNVYDGDCEDVLYMVDHSDSSGTVLYEVTLDIGGGTASTTEISTTEFGASHVASSPDGEEVYIVDQDNPQLAVYDVASDSLGSPTGIDENGYGSLGKIVQAAVSPSGTLYLGSMSENAIFEVSNPGSGSPTVQSRTDLDVDISGADNAFTTNNEFYFYTNAGHVLHTMNLITGDVSEVATLETEKDLTGLALQNSGTGDFIASVTGSNEMIIFDEDGNELEQLTLDIDHTYGDLTTSDLCEEEIFSGTLAEAIGELSPGEEGHGHMLNDGDCYQPGYTRYLGFAWWVPTDVGNEIQGDEVSFDLGFYTEQCRNNDTPGGS
ncbi:SipW-dependent-type signal peptide-containing protein [Halolamina sp. C58]|uniref:SipW-dependent-type signal peptide-containing protein n=1 Tax=Halolamina sp. C58 TaxID=3421640 RepID=UPI003EBBCF3A